MPSSPYPAGGTIKGAWPALAVTTLLFFLVVVDVSAVNVAFPSIGEDLGVPETSLSWILSGYNVTVGSLLLVAGRLADSHGRKKLFIPGVAIFMVGSALSALAPTLAALIAARVIQAVGGAIIAPTALAVVLPDWPPEKRSMVIGLTGATGALGAVAGPAVGSVLIDLWSWQAVFWINVPICLIVLGISPRLLRESRNPNATGKIDLIGVLLGSTAIGSIMVGIVESESQGLFDIRVLGLLVVGAVLIPVLIRRSARHPEPLLELQLFRHQSFSATILGVAFYSMGFTSGFLVNSLFLQRLWELPIAQVGQVLAVSPILAALTSPLSGRLADRVGHRWILAAGSATIGLAFALLALSLNSDPQVWNLYVPINVLAGLGVGTTIATWASAGLSDVSSAQFGTANATVRTVQQVFYALGISIVVTLIATTGQATSIVAYRWAWGFVAVTYLVAAVMVAAVFPAGSSQDRADVI